MYKIACSEINLSELKSSYKNHISIGNKIKTLCENPFSIAVETGIPIIGRYYVTAGRYSLLFNIDEDHQIVHILKIVHSSYLHKIITGRIPAPVPEEH